MRTLLCASLLVGVPLSFCFTARDAKAETQHFQPLSRPQNPPNKASSNRLSVLGGFSWHEFNSPGGHLGVELSLAKASFFESHASAIVSAYSQKHLERGGALHLRWGQRVTAPFGLTFQAQLGLGIQYTSYDTASFEYEDSVAVQKEGRESVVAFSPQVLLGPGFDFSRVSDLPIHIYFSPGITMMYPDLNLAFQVSPFMEFGLRCTLP